MANNLRAPSFYFSFSRSKTFVHAPHYRYAHIYTLTYFLQWRCDMSVCTFEICVRSFRAHVGKSAAP